MQRDYILNPQNASKIGCLFKPGGTIPDGLYKKSWKAKING